MRRGVNARDYGIIKKKWGAMRAEAREHALAGQPPRLPNSPVYMDAYTAAAEEKR